MTSTKDQSEIENEIETFIALPDEQIEVISNALEDDKHHIVIEQISGLSSPDIAELIEKISSDKRDKIIQLYSDNVPPDVFPEIDENIRKEILESMPVQRVSALINELDSDDALDLVLNLEKPFRKDVIKNLSAKTRLTLEEGLNFPEDSAGRLMQREFVAIPQFWTVGKTVDYLRAASKELPDEFFDIFVITPTYHVVGEVPLSRLVKSKRDKKVENLVLDDLHIIPATMDQEELTHIFRREDISSAPVVDEDKRIIGVITMDNIIDVIDEEAQEDIMRLAGVEQSDLYSAVFSTTFMRFKWLSVNLITAILASIVISLFDATIEQMVAIAVLMPIVASMGGNAGTQALTIAVRALATKELSKTNSLRLIWKETIVGTLNGFAFALIIGIISALWFDNQILGAVIASAMIINMIVAGLFGASIPIILNKIGSDPAISSTVFLTTVTDVIGFFAFLGLAALFLI